MMDFILEAWVSSSIERAKASWMLGAGKPWQPGEKLKLLFAGYNGTRNMGSDVRVDEMLRQIRHILGAEQVDLFGRGAAAARQPDRAGDGVVLFLAAGKKNERDTGGNVKPQGSRKREAHRSNQKLRIMRRKR